MKQKETLIIMVNNQSNQIKYIYNKTETLLTSIIINRTYYSTTQDLTSSDHLYPIEPYHFSSTFSDKPAFLPIQIRWLTWLDKPKPEACQVHLIRMNVMAVLRESWLLILDEATIPICPKRTPVPIYPCAGFTDGLSNIRILHEQLILTACTACSVESNVVTDLTLC